MFTKSQAKDCDKVTYGEYSVMDLRLRVDIEPSVWAVPPDMGISPE